MIELLPALLCITIMFYIIYLEIKNPKYGRDIFVDLSITIIVLIVAIYSIYEYQFDFTKTICQLYLGLISLGCFYIGLVFYHEKHPKEVENKTVDEINENEENEEIEESKQND